ncbi:MAG: S26 family signal peptidase [Treponema sp.]|jgi:signal peptidase I|nr:S26 family signal peptidase [Treponema sp.]
MRYIRTKPVILAITAAVILKLFVFDFIIAQGHSMEPSIKNGKVLVVSRLRYGLRIPFVRINSGQNYLFRWAEPKIGEVVVFYTPMGELAVKRCSELTPRGSFFAKGDNEFSSYDSRAYGPVPLDNIIGKVLGY